MRKIAPVLPIDLSEGTVKSWKEDELKDLIKQNLKMILLTIPGERIMQPTYGVGIKRYLFELETNDNVYDILIDDIAAQVKKYLPVINVYQIKAIIDSSATSVLGVTISYNIDFLSVRDSLDLLLETY